MAKLFNYPLLNTSSNVTLNPKEYEYINVTAPATVTLPLLNQTLIGQPIIVNNNSNGLVIIQTQGSDTINGGSTATLAAGESFYTISNNNGSWNVLGGSVPSFANIANMVYVSKSGDDSTGERETPRAFLTINAALAAAQAGDVVFVYPGDYEEIITIPDNVSIIGMTPGVSNIIQNNINADTDLVTMGENCRLENISLIMTSTQHVNLRGIVFPNTSSTTSKILTFTLTIDNSTAGAGTSNIYGIESEGTGFGALDINTSIRAATIVIRSTGDGDKIGLLASNTNSFAVRDTVIRVIKVGGGTDTYYEAVTTNAGAVISLRWSSVFGTSNNLMQIEGIIKTDTIWKQEHYNLSGYTTLGPHVIATNDNTNIRSVYFAFLNQFTFADVEGAITMSTPVNSANIGVLSSAASVSPNAAVPRAQALPAFGSVDALSSGFVIWKPGDDLSITFENDPTNFTGSIDIIYTPEV